MQKTHTIALILFVLCRIALPSVTAFAQEVLNPLLIAPTLTVSVKNSVSHAPIAGATVLVGNQEGVPFATNKAVTGPDGIATFSDPILQSGTPLSVTAQMSGYGNYTISANSDSNVELNLEPNPNPSNFSFISGKVLGFPGSDRQTLDIGFLAPAIRAESFLSFNPQDIVSSYTIEIDAYGKHNVPGNVVLPSQDKTYFIFPVHLEKPSFLMPLPNGTRTHFAGLTSTVNLSDAIKDIGDKDFLSILNIASFNHINWTNRLTLAGNINFDINASQALSQKNLTSTYKNIPSGLDTVALSLLDPEQDRADFITMDIKSLPAASAVSGTGQIKLASLSQRIATDDYYVFSGVFHHEDFNNVTDRQKFRSRAIAGCLKSVNADNTVNFDTFFQLIKTTAISADRRNIQFSSPNTSALQADFILVNIYSEALNDTTKGVTHKVLWSAKLPGNATEVKLPSLGQNVLPTPNAATQELFYLEIIGLKAVQGTSPLNTQNSIHMIEHVSSFVQKL